MKKWNLIVDVDRCNNCNNCLIATKDEYSGNDFPGYSAPQPDLGTLWLTVKRHERGQAPMIDVSHYVETCNHCDNPACITDKTRDAVYKRPDGIVMIDPVAANAHLLDNGWNEPRCTQVCPTQAIRAVKQTDDEMAQMVLDEGLGVLKPELGLSPRVYYRNFQRIETAFIGGTLHTVENGVDDCLEGATVRLEKGGQPITETVSDAYGDFKCDGLKIDGAEFAIVIEQDGKRLNARTVAMEGSVFLGSILIER